MAGSANWQEVCVGGMLTIKFYICCHTKVVITIDVVCCVNLCCSLFSEQIFGWPEKYTSRPDPNVNVYSTIVTSVSVGWMVGLEKTQHCFAVLQFTR